MSTFLTPNPFSLLNGPLCVDHSRLGPKFGSVWRRVRSGGSFRVHPVITTVTFVSLSGPFLHSPYLSGGPRAELYLVDTIRQPWEARDGVRGRVLGKVEETERRGREPARTQLERLRGGR